jgi:hypothetical protein
MLIVVFAVFWRFSPERSTLLGSMVGVLFLTVALTIFTQVLDRVRSAVRHGFMIEDVVTAFALIADETERARGILLADPVEGARIGRRKKLAMMGGFFGGVAMGVLPTFVVIDGQGRQALEPAGGLLLLGATVFVGIAIALWTARPVRITLAQRIAGWIWSSTLGRAVFARAQRRYARERQR